VRGVQKHDKKYQKNKSDPIPFSCSDPLTHHGGHRFFFCRSLAPVGTSGAAALSAAAAHLELEPEGQRAELRNTDKKGSASPRVRRHVTAVVVDLVENRTRVMRAPTRGLAKKALRGMCLVIDWGGGRGPALPPARSVPPACGVYRTIQGKAGVSGNESGM
jgi:hypothetical protein